MAILTDRFLQQIKAEKLVPQPRWHMYLKKSLAFLGLILSVMAAALSAGLVIELVNALSLFEFIRFEDAHLVLEGLPYAWIIALAVCLAAAVIFFIKNFYGYRYKLKYVIAIFSYLAVSVGIGAYAFGVSNKIESFLEIKVPSYEKLTKTPESLWLEPEEGLLYGEIALDPECNCLKIKGGDDESWQIEASDGNLDDIIGNIEDGPVKIMGEKTGDNKFRVDKIIRGRVKGDADEKKKPKNIFKKKEKRDREKTEQEKSNPNSASNDPEKIK